MAKAVGVSDSTVGRIWRQHGLTPHQTRTFKLSNDPRFAGKLEDIVGLYVNLPERAVVLCADEKSQSAEKARRIGRRFAPSSSSSRP